MPVIAPHLLAIGTDIEVYDADENDGPPIYSGGVEDAFMTLEPGLYPFSLETYEDCGGGDMQDVTRTYLLVVTGDESFAVYTTVEYPRIIEVTVPLYGV